MPSLKAVVEEMVKAEEFSAARIIVNKYSSGKPREKMSAMVDEAQDRCYRLAAMFDRDLEAEAGL